MISIIKHETYILQGKVGGTGLNLPGGFSVIYPEN